MINLTVKTEGLPEMLRRFDRAAGLPRTRGEVRVQGEKVQYALREYAPQRSRPQIWSDDPEKRRRQIRGFFYYLHAGAIHVPYQRTRRLARAWRFDWRASVDSMNVIVENDLYYAPLVQSSDWQTRYHRRSGWRTVEEVFRAHELTAVQAIFDAVEQDTSA